MLGARRVDRVERLADEIGAGRQAVLETDVTDRDAVERLVDRAVDMHSRIDVMLNNAGLMPSPMLERLHVDEWDRMIDVNTKGVLYGSRQLCLADSTRRLTVQRTVRAAPQRPLSVARGKADQHNKEISLLYTTARSCDQTKELNNT